MIPFAHSNRMRFRIPRTCSAGSSSLLVALGVLLGVCQTPAQSPDEKAVQLFRAALPQLRATHPENYDTPGKLQAAWKRFQENLALARTARAMGYAERPEIAYRVEQLLAQELILRDAEKARPLHSITEAEVNDHLARHREHFESPAQMSAHEIVLRFDPRKEGDRAAQWERAGRVRSSFGQGLVPMDRFLAAVKIYSDPEFVRTNGGCLGVFAVSTATNAASPMVPAAARELLVSRQPGALSQVHEMGDTFRIYLFSDYRDAVLSSSAGVRDGVRRALYLQAREKRIKELAARSGMDLDAALGEQQVTELLALAAANRIQTADLPPSPAGADIPLPEPSPAKPSRRP